MNLAKHVTVLRSATPVQVVQASVIRSASHVMSINTFLEMPVQLVVTSVLNVTKDQINVCFAPIILFSKKVNALVKMASLWTTERARSVEILAQPVLMATSVRRVQADSALELHCVFSVPLTSISLLTPVLTVGLSANNVTKVLTSAFSAEIILSYRMVYVNVKTAFSWMERHALSVANLALLVKVLINV